MCAMYSKTVYPVIQPISDLLMSQPSGAALTRAAGIISYFNILMQRAHLPNTFVPNKVVTFSFPSWYAHHIHFSHVLQ